MECKTCPFMGPERSCQYADCMLFNKAAAQCSIAIIAEDMRSISADHSTIADSLPEISNELQSIATVLKGLV